MILSSEEELILIISILHSLLTFFFSIHQTDFWYDNILFSGFFWTVEAYSELSFFLVISGEKMKNITAICKNQKHIELCKRYQIIITDLYNEINNQKERMYLSLGSELVEDNNYKRKKGD